MLLVSFTNSFFFQKALYGWSERGMATQNRAVDQAPLASHVTLPPPRGGSESCGPLLHTQEARHEQLGGLPWSDGPASACAQVGASSPVSPPGA